MLKEDDEYHAPSDKVPVDGGVFVPVTASIAGNHVWAYSSFIILLNNHLANVIAFSWPTYFHSPNWLN